MCSSLMPRYLTFGYAILHSISSDIYFLIVAVIQIQNLLKPLSSSDTVRTDSVGSKVPVFTPDRSYGSCAFPLLLLGLLSILLFSAPPEVCSRVPNAGDGSNFGSGE